MPHSRFDCLIAGAGPAGSTAAFLLASHGRRVALFDRRRFPRPKLCGGLLTAKTLRTVETVFHAGAEALQTAGVLRGRSRRFRIASGRGRETTGTLNEPFLIVDRQDYDYFWLQKAIDAGAFFFPETAAVEFDPDRPRLMTAGGEAFSGEHLIGADGIDSLVRRALFRAKRLSAVRRDETAAALEITVPFRPGDAYSDRLTLFYGFMPWGYAWSFPCPPTHRILGMAGLRRKAGRRLRPAFEQWLASLGLNPASGFRIASRPLPYGNFLPQPGAGNTLLVGDAAGLADPFLGEGIYYAHRSAQLAAQAILAVGEGPPSALDAYVRSYRRFLYPELRYARAGRQLIFSLPPRLYYPAISALLHLMPRILEEAVQGRRSFRWFKPF